MRTGKFCVPAAEVSRTHDLCGWSKARESKLGEGLREFRELVVQGCLAMEKCWLLP